MTLVAVFEIAGKKGEPPTSIGGCINVVYWHVIPCSLKMKKITAIWISIQELNIKSQKTTKQFDFFYRKFKAYKTKW